MPSSCYSEKMLWNPSVGGITQVLMSNCYCFPPGNSTLGGSQGELHWSTPAPPLYPRKHCTETHHSLRPPRLHCWVRNTPCTHTHTQMHVHKHAHRHTYTHNTHKLTNTRTNSQTHAHTHKFMYTNTHKRTYTNTHIHTYTHTHTHTHTVGFIFPSCGRVSLELSCAILTHT